MAILVNANANLATQKPDVKDVLLQDGGIS